MSGHVDSETLAAFREELLPRRKARQVAAHLAHCAQCAGLDAQLADLPGLLARTSAPPMPDALTARIEAALAAEAAARSMPAGAAAEAPGGADAGAAPTQPGNAAGGRRRRARGARPAPAPDRSRLALRIAAAAAAVVVVGGGGYEVTRLLSGGGEAGQASTGSGASVRAPAAGRAAPSQPEMGAPEHGAASAGTSGSKARSPLESPSASAPMLSSGINYRTDQLKTQVQATIARVRGKAPSPIPSSPMNGTSVLTSCLKQVAGNQRPLLVDTARYNGSPATIIVLTTTSAKTLRVVVVGPHCSATQTDLITSTVIPAPR